MSRPGPKPKPIPIKKLAGNPGKRSLEARRALPAAGDPLAPKGHLPREGYELWNALAPRLIELGLFTELDRQTLEMMCLHYAYANKAERILRKEGLLASGSQGQDVKHPAHQMLLDHSRQFLRYAAEFGMTPSSRSKIEIAEKEPDDLVSALFKRINASA